MINQSSSRAALMGAAILAITASAGYAQTEMTDKIRLENAAAASNKYDVSVVGGNLGITRNDGSAAPGTIINGNVGIGTNTPAAPLHVVKPTFDGPFMLQLSNAGGVSFLLDRTAGSPNDWQFANFGTAFQITVVGHPVGEFTLTDTGDLTIRHDVFANAFHGTLVGPSSVTLKENFKPIDEREILTRLDAMPVSEWRYKTDPGTRHIGPTAEDFQATFGLGMTGNGLNVTDVNGVTLAAVQALHAELKDRDAQIAALTASQAELLKRLEALEKQQ